MSVTRGNTTDQRNQREGSSLHIRINRYPISVLLTVGCLPYLGVSSNDILLTVQPK